MLNDIDPIRLTPIVRILREQSGPPRYLRMPDETMALARHASDNAYSYGDRSAANDTPYATYAEHANALGLSVLDMDYYGELHLHWRAVRLVTTWLYNALPMTTTDPDLNSAIGEVLRVMLTEGGLTESEFGTL